MKDYDPRGRPKTPQELPESEPVFSENLSNTKGNQQFGIIIMMDSLFDSSTRGVTLFLSTLTMTHVS